MLQLNIPAASLRVEMRAGKLRVWDFLRHRWIVLTPEEWVRQQFTHWMTEHLGYPAARLGNEVTIAQNGMKRRCDSIFYDREGRPAVIIEYKAPYVALTERVLDQVLRYNLVLQVPVLIVTNGMEHWTVTLDEKKTPRVQQGVPSYQNL